MAVHRINLSAVIIPALVIFMSGQAGNTNNSISDTDPVIQYYLDQTGKIFGEHYLFGQNIKYSVEMRAIYEQTDYRGEMQKLDTAVYRMYCDGSRRDSTVIIDSAGAKENSLPETFDFPRPWNKDYQYYFYPNDTGAGLLAIGFVEKKADSTAPITGFININRDDFYLIDIFYHDPSPQGLFRRSERLHFRRLTDYIILDFYSIQIIERNLLGWRYFSCEFEFIEYQLNSD
nr:hypothetical protein [candidate division Zixibacteria bacterium]